MSFTQVFVDKEHFELLAAVPSLFLMTKSASVCRLGVDVEYRLVQHSILADSEVFDVPGGIE
jgi:hypothetical protein